MPELEGVALPFLTKQTFPEWPLPPLKRQDFTHKICPGWDCHQKFHSEKIPRNSIGTVFVLARKKMLLPRNSVRLGKAHYEGQNGTERN
jgi:hypothetical protein